jgi:enoyl-CoA hydratase
MDEPVVKRVTGRAVELRLNRPDVGNALDLVLVDALSDALDAIDAKSCDTVILSGEGKGFCGGLNLSNLDAETDASLLLLLTRIELLLQKVANLPQQTVALAHRFAFGAGADLFVACRQRIAAPDTKFAFPGVRFGIALGTGRLARRVGPDTARRMLAATTPIALEDALASGLASETLAPEDWPRIVETLDSARTSLDPSMARVVAERLNPGKDDEDLAALVRTASVPGLKDRVASYAAKVAAARKT